MTLNGVIAISLRFLHRIRLLLLANYVTVVEDRPIGLMVMVMVMVNVNLYSTIVTKSLMRSNVRKYCLPVPVFHFSP